MRILIATASRHGSTRELGHWLGSAIAERLYGAMDSVTVEVLDAADVDGIAGYDAVIIGSGVYMGHWLREARSLVKRERVELENRPVWLFSSGPIDEETPSATSSKWNEASWAIEHRVFGGKLDRSELSRFERLVVKLIQADDGDTRSRTDIDEWADAICATLSASTPQAR